MMLASDVIAKKTAQYIKKELEKITLAENRLDPMKILYALRKYIKPVDMEHTGGKSTKYLKREVILSEYFLK